MKIQTISERKQRLIDEKNVSPFEVGERIAVKEYLIDSWTKDQNKIVNCKIVEVLPDSLRIVQGDGSTYKEIKTVSKSDVQSREVWQVGANPFDTRKDSVRPVAFTLESILFGLDVFEDKNRAGGVVKMNGIEVKESNWNPYVYDKEGSKQYYQRPFVWTIDDKRLLLESIYRGIDCGRILVRKRGWKELERMAGNGETELAFLDIVDGKQRLNTIKGFMLDEYTDSQGNYYSDLSFEAQHRFTNHQLFLYAEMPEESRDEDVLYQFLKLNFAGVPQSKEHIEHVRQLQEKV